MLRIGLLTYSKLGFEERTLVLHLPPHPGWFWLVAIAPYAVWLGLWVAARNGRVRLKRLRPWLILVLVFSFPAYLVYDVLPGHRAAHMVFEATFNISWLILLWTLGWYEFETLNPPDAKWYTPWKGVRFSMRDRAIIRVADVESAAAWYISKLGLLRSAERQAGRPEMGAFRFKEDGKSIVLAPREALTSDKRLILFTKKIDKMKDVLVARGIEVKSIERDRQGTQYFEFYDPDGNEIEIVQA